MKINVITLCSGYDSQALAFERLKRNFPNFDYELIAWAEFDPDSKSPIEKQPAVVAHNALFPQWSDRNMGDITKADWSVLKEPIDLLCYSTPCQSISNAGLQHGFKEGSGTRSSVIWSVLNAIKTLRPKYLLMENVAAMVQSKFIKDFHEWQNAVASLGYTHYTDILNSKDFGVAQNRERVFMVSVRNDIGMRYHFPKPFKLEKRLKDVLETNVDEKYYLSEKMLNYFERVNADKSHGHNFTPKQGADVAFTIRTAPGQRVDDNFILTEGYCSNSQNGRVVNPKGISPAMVNGEKDGSPKILEQCDIHITEIKCVDYKAPNGSSGTGYSQYFIIEIKYSNGTIQQMDLHTWYRSIEVIISDFLSGLNYCPDMKYQKADVLLLFIALSEWDANIWEDYKAFVEHNKEGWIIG